MTEPTPVEPGAQPAEVVPAVPVAGDPAPTDDISAWPEAAQKLIKDLRNEAAKYRTRGQSAAEEARAQAQKELTNQIAKALGIAGEDEPVDPAELTAQIEQAQQAQFGSAVELILVRAAGSLGLDVDEAMDSNRFMDAFSDALEEDQDIASRSQAELAEAVKAAASKALEKYPRFRTAAAAGQAPAATTAPRPDPSQGSRGPASGRVTDLHEAVRRQMAGGR